MPTGVLEEQYAQLLLRVRRGTVSLADALAELGALAHRPAIIGDVELAGALTRIDHEHRAGLLRTHPTGWWAGAPTGRAIAELVAVGKVKLPAVRDAYYTLYLGLRPFDADDPDR
uniref:hypothetical protein n=1 Tax=Actinokineospora sp. CA-119265 TaxID=3239890 RepID=UPI003F498E31